MAADRHIGFALAVTALAALAGYVARRGRRARDPASVEGRLGARIVDEVPHSATVVDASSKGLDEIPGARRAIDRAFNHGGTDRWVELSLAGDAAARVVDAIREATPYYEGRGGEYNGLYVRCEDRVVVLDAIGWARFDEPCP